MTTKHQPTTTTELNLNSLFDALRRPLDLIEDPERREELERILESSRAMQELAVFKLLSDMAAKISASQHASLVLEEDGTLRIVEVEAPAESPTADEEPEDDGEMRQASIRLPRKLKTAIDSSAEASGTSVNAWYVRAVARAMGRGGPRGRDLRERIAARHGGRGERGAGIERDGRGPNGLRARFFEYHVHSGRGGEGLTRDARDTRGARSGLHRHEHFGHGRRRGRMPAKFD